MRTIWVTTFGLVSIMLMGRDPKEDRDELVDEGLPKCITELGGDKKESGEGMTSAAGGIENEREV
jgi:hypothetical protein